MNEGLKVDLLDDGLLYLINKAVFHPRGFSLGYNRDTKEFLLLGDGSESWHFSAEMEDQKFPVVEKTLRRAITKNAPLIAAGVREAEQVKSE